MLVVLPEVMQAARLRLVRERPYLSAALWAMKPIERPGLGTMAVDAWWRLYYDPSVAEKWTIEQIGGVLYHETLHLLRDHAGRCEAVGAEKSVWNLAADIEINDDLFAEGVNLPDDPLLPEDFGFKRGLLAEEYYALLKQGSGGQAATGVSHEPSPGMGNCGSCAHGQQEAWEDAPGTDSPAVSKAEAELVRRQVANEVREACKTRGKVPGHLKRWAETVLSPKADWRRVLAGAVRVAAAHTSGAVDYSYAKPSRRQGQVGNGKIVLPSLRRPVPEVAVVVDTSGSISKDMLTQALTEVRGVLTATGAGAVVLSVDAAVHVCKRVFDARRVRLEGGGGTDMGVGIEAALKIRPRPHVIVVLTDGYTPWPHDKPPAKVVVGILGDGPSPPAWAKEVRIL